MKRVAKYSVETRERAVRLVFDHEREHASPWAAISSISAKVGCTAETLRKWVRRAERDSGRRPGLATDERARLKDLEREVRELKRANEILRKASAYFAQAKLEDVELATLEWVWWFNDHRLLGPLGHVPPAEFEEQYLSRQTAQAETLTLKSISLR